MPRLRERNSEHGCERNRELAREGRMGPERRQAHVEVIQEVTKPSAIVDVCTMTIVLFYCLVLKMRE